MNEKSEIDVAKEVFFKRCKDVILANFRPTHPITYVKFYISFYGNLCLKTNDDEMWNLSDGEKCLRIDDASFEKREILDKKLFLEVLKKSKDHDIFIFGVKKVLSRGETLESLLLEKDLEESF